MILNTYTHNIFIFNSKTNIMKKSKAFTMIEILILCVVLWAWLVSIFQAANRAKMTSERVTQTIIANQLATEWVEILYQFRNTNFLRHQERDISWKTKQEQKENPRNWNKCRLALDYNNNAQKDSTCNTLLLTWYYYITTDSSWKNEIVKCYNPNCEENIASATGIIDDVYAICLTGWIRTSCTGWHEAWWDQSKYWKFYRTIRSIWIYDMASDETWGILIPNLEDAEKADAQEYRFCSVVARRGWQNWEIEICSTMTNFVE